MVYVRGYGHGTETSWIEASQEAIRGAANVPAAADLVAIPLMTILNGDPALDSEAGIEITVADAVNHDTVRTYASHILDTSLGVDYVVAFADVSSYQGRSVNLTITLRQTDVCAGSACTHDVDLFVGDLWYERLPDICTTDPDGDHTLYDYYDDPSPRAAAECDQPQPNYYVEVEEGPHNHYGPGEDGYVVSANLPAGAEALQFKVYYGHKSRGVTTQAAGASIPIE